MKKIKYLLLGMIAVMASCVGGGNDEVKNFAIDFATKISKNQVDSIRAFYPDAEKMDSFALSYSPDSIKVEETDQPNLFKVTFSNTANMMVECSEDGKMVIKKSDGLYAIDPARLDFALKTGWIANGMTDAEMAERLQDNEFESTLQAKFVKDIKSKLKAKITGTWGDDIIDGDMWVSAKGAVITVYNNSEVEIPGNAYSVTYRKWYWGAKNQIQSESVAGITIPAGGKAVLKTSRLGPTMEDDHDVLLNIREGALTGLFMESFTPTGNEYQEYLNTK